MTQTAMKVTAMKITVEANRREKVMTTETTAKMMTKYQIYHQLMNVEGVHGELGGKKLGHSIQETVVEARSSSLSSSALAALRPAEQLSGEMDTASRPRRL